MKNRTAPFDKRQEALPEFPGLAEDCAITDFDADVLYEYNKVKGER